MTDTFERNLAAGLTRLAERGVPSVGLRPSIDEIPTPHPGPTEPTIVVPPPEVSGGTTKRWWQAAAVLVVIAAVSGLFLIRSGPRVTHQSVGVADGWTAIAPSPLAPREHHTAVWTGTEMIVWGGETTGPADCNEDGTSCSRTSVYTEEGRAPDNQMADGAAYDPATDTWRMLAPAPIQPRSHHGAIWTGTEMIVWGGSNGYRPDQLGAAYDPASDTWRILPETTATQIFEPVLLWDGEIMHAFSTVGDGEDGVHHLRYDPVTDTWSDPTPIGLRLAETGLAAADGSLHVAGRGDDRLLRIGVESIDGVEWRPAASSGELIQASGPRLLVDGTKPGEVVRIESIRMEESNDNGTLVLGFERLFDTFDGWIRTTFYPVEGDEPRIPSTIEDVLTGTLFVTTIHDGRALTIDWTGRASVGVIGGRWVHLPDPARELELGGWGASYVWTGEAFIRWGGRGSPTDFSVATGATIAIDPLPADELE